MKKNKSSKNWLNKQNKDYFFKQSKILGYRSRSAFKLIEMNNKFKFLKKNLMLLDLGCAPGGWSQVARKEIKKGKILGVDIKTVEKIQDVKFLKGDFNEKSIYDEIVLYFGSEIDVVLSDMSINTTGNKSLDSYRTGQLCLNAIKLAKKILCKEGVFLSKIFMGEVFKEIDKSAKKHFKEVIKYKPKSSKKESKEIYIFCKGLLKV